jgi:hypothetical protein
VVGGVRGGRRGPRRSAGSAVVVRGARLRVVGGWARGAAPKGGVCRGGADGFGVGGRWRPETNPMIGYGWLRSHCPDSRPATWEPQ